MKKQKYPEYNQVYVWELPVRFIHWTTAACVFFLGVTGLLIGTPLTLQSSSEASFQYLFGINRFLHFAFAYIFLFSFLGRVYWGFVGNEFVRWRNFFPLTARRWREVWQVICLDILQICSLPIKSIANNGLAGIIYSGVFFAIFFQIVTGFALYSAMSKSWFPKLFVWVMPLMGGEANVRQWHHLMTWVFVVFTMGHIYLSWYHDYLEGRGTISSMIGGWKFIERLPQK